VSKLTNQWIDAFRAGKHGTKGEFTTADIDRIVANYKPEDHEAPVCVGHPVSNAPAYAWVAKVRRQGDVLQFQSHQVEPQFEEMVEAGRFKKRSASFYKDKATGLITGLRHIGFLGAQPPEVKGLKDVQFEDAGNEVAEVTFEEESMAQEDATLLDKLLAKFEERFGKKPETASFTEAQVKEFATAAVTEAIAPLQAKLDAQAVSFAESQKKITTGETKGRALDAINKLKADGKWVPAFDKSHLSLVFEELAKSTEVVEFGEGAEKKSVTPLDALVNFMEQLPKIVPTGEVYGGQRMKPAVGSVHFSEEGGKADQNSVELANLSKTRAGEKNISFSEAMNQVIVERPELVIPGGASAGAV
jgi:hypothetical protein